MERSEQPHLVSLVLQSKKALQYGEQLCSRANNLSNASAQCAIDVLALDAKVRWISDAVLEQLKLAASVAKSIEEKRAQLTAQIHDWDARRIQRSDELDSILESLGSQLVPPDFHQSSADSSIFGSQHSDDEPANSGHASATQRSPTLTLRNESKHHKSKSDRQKWKTLRDFVDDRAIEDALENMDNARSALDDVLGATDDYPETLSNAITAIRDSLPEPYALPAIKGLLTSQDTSISGMAGHLESLAAHYEQMAGALRESEAGEAFSEEDLQDMNRDTEELPSIMSELQDSMSSIEAIHERLRTAKDVIQKNLDHHKSTIDDLDELGEIMTEMLQRQQDVDSDVEEQLEGLQQHLLSLEHLHQQFLSYQTAFSKLILEMARRRQYREAAENIVKGMMTQLESMTEEERQVRDNFNAEHGASLPEDLCLCVGNHPTKWGIVPWDGDALDALPEIDNDLIVAATERLVHTEGALGTESL